MDEFDVDRIKFEAIMLKLEKLDKKLAESPEEGKQAISEEYQKLYAQLDVLMYGKEGG